MSLMMVLAMAVPMSVSAAETLSKDIGTEEEFLEAINSAKNGDIIKVTNSFTCNSAVNIKENITITGEKITFKTPGLNSMTIIDNAKVILKDITIANTGESKSVIHVYGSNLTANNITVEHGGKTGAPIIVNHESSASFNGINLNLGENSWYGVNVDSATATFNDVTTNQTIGTQSVICAEKGGTVNGSNLTIVKTKDGQTAYVDDSNLPEFVEQKKIEKKDVTEIILQKDVNLSSPLYLNEDMTVKGGHSFIGGNFNKNVVTITSEGVVLDNIGIKTSAANKSALHVYKVSAKLRNVTLDNTQTSGGAGLVVNSAAPVIVEGTLNIKVGESSWGGINVDAKSGDAEIVFADGAKVNYETLDESKPAMYKECSNGFTVTIKNADSAGLVENENGTYSPIEGETPTEPVDPENPPTTSKPETPLVDKTDTTPQTSDDTNLGLMFAIMGTAAVLATGTLVYGRRKHNG